MRFLRSSVREYLAMRRDLGFKLKTDEKLLMDFVAFVKRRRATHITVKLAVAWAQGTGSKNPNYHAGRLRAVRSFARYYSAFDPKTEIPMPDLLPRRRSGFEPHLYTEDEIRRLMDAILQGRRSDTRITRWGQFTLIGLLSATGLRVSEAFNLDLDDVDLDQGVLTIRNSKFGKSRLIPLHASTRAALRNYLARRHECFSGGSMTPFFVTHYGTRMKHSILHRTFIRLSRRIGLRGHSDTHGPRLHDLRHRMAVEVLHRCYRSGADPERRLPALSTYLGHTSLSHTYVYLHQHPSLMKQAMSRLENHWNSPR
jgi:integrase/recombinase XerD